MKEMSTLNINGNKYEVVDAKARDGLSDLKNDKSNPHDVTAEQVGAYSIDEADAIHRDLAMNIGHVENEFAKHAGNFVENPHEVTAEQVGAYTKDETMGVVFQSLALHESRADNPHGVTAEQLGVYTKEDMDAKLTPATYYSGEVEFTNDNVTVVSGEEYANQDGNKFNTSGEKVVYRIDVSGKVEFSGSCGGALHTIMIDGETEVAMSSGDDVFSYSGQVKEYIEITVSYASVTFGSFTVENFTSGFMSGEDKEKLDTLSESVGNIDTALDELHAYAQGLISGGASE
jgi:hypothetical protein